MDFSLDQQQQLVRESTRRFAQGELGGDLGTTTESFKAAWTTCAEFGVLGSALPTQYGGSDNGLLTTILMMEGLGYGCSDHGLLFSLNAQMWSVQHPLLKFGTSEQREKYLAALCRGEIIGGHGMTEPDSGSDAFSLRTSARKVKDGYILNGSKSMVTNAPLAELFVVFANLQPDRGLMGITAFLVERDTQGLSTGVALEKLGLESSPMSELVMEDCFVHESCRLGPEGSGAAVFNSSMEWERGAILATQLGSMERQLEESADYARTRRQFRHEIGKAPPIRDRIANMRVRLELARLILYKVGWLKDCGRSAILEATIAKLFVSESQVQSSLDAMRIFGGYGYLRECRRESELRDAIGGLFYSGTSDMQRVVIAGLLGL